MDGEPKVPGSMLIERHGCDGRMFKCVSKPQRL